MLKSLELRLNWLFSVFILLGATTTKAYNIKKPGNSCHNIPPVEYSYVKQSCSSVVTLLAVANEVTVVVKPRCPSRNRFTVGCRECKTLREKDLI